MKQKVTLIPSMFIMMFISFTASMIHPILVSILLYFKSNIVFLLCLVLEIVRERKKPFG